MVIPFHRRELVKAYKQAYNDSQADKRTNAHRLLLFYSAECGLKAILLKNLSLEILDKPLIDEHKLSHDLNKILDLLYAGREIRLPVKLELTPLRLSHSNKIPRKPTHSDLNQVWRYGGSLLDNGDTTFELALEKIHTWIEENLR